MLKHAAILAAVLAGFFWLARGTVMSGPFSYDEADYMYAASRGLLANAADSPTIPLLDLIETGLHRGGDVSAWSGLSVMIRERDDMVFYRHWHGPLFIDWLHIAKPLASNERAMRALNFVFPIAAALLMYFGALICLPGAAGQIAAILAPVLFLWNFAVIGANELAPHELFGLCVVAALLLVTRLVLAAEDPARPLQKYWYAALVTSALAFCTLEVSFALIATVLLCGHAVRDRLKPNLAFATKSAATFLAVVLIVWPAAIFKLSFVKAYLFMAYLAIFRKGAWGADISVARTWWLRFVQSPVPWLLLACVIGVLIARRRAAWSPVLLPSAIYSVSMFLAILRVNTDLPRYILPLYPGVVLLIAFAGGLWLSRFRPAMQYAAVTGICAAVFFTTLPQLRALPRNPDPRNFAMIELVSQNHLATKRLLVPQIDVPTIHYYFPESHPRGYMDERTIPARLQTEAFDAVISCTHSGAGTRACRVGTPADSQH